MFKNVGAQKLTVLAFADAGHAALDAGEPVTGDAAQITCKVEQDDDGTQSAITNTNPTEVEDGQYRFDLTQAETNGDKLTFYPESSTAGVQVVALPSNVIYTRPQYFPDMSLTSGGVTRANDASGNAVAVASVQPDNKPTVDASGHTEAVKADGSAFHDPTKADIADQVLREAFADHSGVAGSLAAKVAEIAANIETIEGYTEIDGHLDTDLGTLLTRLSVARAGALTDLLDGGRLDLILDEIAGDVANLDGAPMRGTDSAYTGTPPTATAIRDAILDRVVPGNHDTANTVGAFLQVLDAAISSRSSHSAAEVLGMNMSSVEASAEVNSLCELILATFNSVLSGTSWSIKKTDGTAFHTRAVTLDGEATAVTGVSDT